LLDIGGEVWAIDHVRLVYDAGLVPALDDIADDLRTVLERLATEHDRHLIVSYVVPVLSETERLKARERRRVRNAERQAVIDRVMALATQAVTTGRDRFLHDGYTTVRFAVSTPTDGERVHLYAVTSAGPWLDAQVDEGLANALGSKVNEQLANAKQAGYRVMLLIDQIQDPMSSQPSQFLATTETVRTLVDRVRKSRRECSTACGSETDT
jgi:hypothetical protein